MWLPSGVYNVVPGYGPTAGAAITSHMRIRKVGFTGSTAIGRTVMEQAARSNLKQVQLELGGKSPVVFSDANVKEAVKLSAFAVFNNNGQLCTAGSRTFVHESIYDEFVKEAALHARTYKVGDPMDTNTTVGPLISELQMKKVLDYVKRGSNDGARLLTSNYNDSNKNKNSGGFFVQPTVFADVTPEMTIAKEEIFGPVQSIIKFKNEDTVIKLCNASEYGLAAAVLTKDVGVIFRLSDALQAGTIWVNTYHQVHPQSEFGGYKQSGYGREGGETGILGWTTVKSVIMQTQHHNL